ncbi:MAG: PRC-barrel domain-containing protein [Candidatus Hadarchaeia archaeon]
MSRILASNLRDMKVLTNKGLRVGRVFDLEVDEDSGKIETVVIEPESPEISNSFSTDEDERVLIPFGSVMAVRDYIVVSEKSLAVHKMKRS